MDWQYAFLIKKRRHRQFGKEHGGANRSRIEKTYQGNGLDSLNENGKWIGNTLFLYRIGGADVYNKQKDGSYALITRLYLGTKFKITNIIKVGDKYFLSVWGAGIYMMDGSLKTPIRKIWSGRADNISADKEGDLWITTDDDGIYVIKNRSVVNYSSLNGLLHDNVTALYCGDEGKLFFGNTYGELFCLYGNGVEKVDLKYTSTAERVRGVTLLNNRIYLITNNVVGYLDKGKSTVADIYHISGGPKCILKLKDNKTILFGLLASIINYNSSTNRGVELEFSKRVITMALHPDGEVYCGSLDGIYRLRDNKLEQVESRDFNLRTRVTSLCFTPDSILWIGTPSNGVIAFDGKNVLAHITPSGSTNYNGAICRKIVAGDHNEIWVATNSGINKVKYHLHDSLVIDNIIPINTLDGLLSDDVNDIIVHDSLVYAATSHGLCILNEKHMAGSSSAPIYLSALYINDADSAIHDGEYQLGYAQNNLRIEYVGILLPSASYMRYQYRLLGSGNDKWEITTNTSIEFRSLSSGHYVFEVAALDKFGNRSKQLAIVRFRITPAFYRTLWFWGIIFVVVLGIGFYIIRFVFRRRQVQYEKEQSYNTKIVELEQQALKAQMNPHFIFNCLTAIQHFVNKEDVYSANMYLSNFAKLIRKTLDLSGEQFITLDKELAYLENYIQLEKMRFQDKFNYSITVGSNVDTFTAQVPPMLLQPIIENAIRHGLRYKENNEGMLVISFEMKGNVLVCRIDDNGIGIQRSKELKTSSHVEYQSKGMKLTEARISAINMISQKKISMEVADKHDQTGAATGTLVVINFEQ